MKICLACEGSLGGVNSRALTTIITGRMVCQHPTHWYICSAGFYSIGPNDLCSRRVGRQNSPDHKGHRGHQSCHERKNMFINLQHCISNILTHYGKLSRITCFKLERSFCQSVKVKLHVHHGTDLIDSIRSIITQLTHQCTRKRLRATSL